MSGVSNTILATSVFLTTLAGLGAGYMMSPPPVRSGDSRPIIDPDAWSKTAPVSPTFQAQLNSSQTAMKINMTGDDMNQRGWIPSNDVEADTYQGEIQPIDVSDNSNSIGYTVEQLDGAAPVGDRGSSSITVLDKAEADRAWDSEPASTVSEQPADTAPASTSN